MRDEKRTLDDGTIIHKYQVIGTPGYYYQAWEPDPEHNHRTIMHFDEKRYGEIRSRELPADLEALPSYSEERYHAVKAWYAERDTESYELITRAFPETTNPNARRQMGELFLVDPA